jgi:XTP/dITP diphosphohydrolase
VQKPVVVLATHNSHKVREIRRILGRGPYRLKGLEDFPPPYAVRETGKTLAANALLKARAAARRTGQISLADDTGLEVRALGGAPGVYSARYAGAGCGFDDNNRKLLKKMAPHRARGAAFRTAVALVFPDGREKVFVGTCAGRITREPRGGKGFGYDPVFRPRGSARTFAEMTLAQKNGLSHRARAFRKAAVFLNRVFACR